MPSSCTTSRSATLLSSNTIFIGNPLQANKECTKLCAQRGSTTNPCSGTVEALEIYNAQFAGELVTFWYDAGKYDDPTSEIPITFPPTISGTGNGAILQNAGGYIFEVISDLGRIWQNFTIRTGSVKINGVSPTGLSPQSDNVLTGIGATFTALVIAPLQALGELSVAIVQAEEYGFNLFLNRVYISQLTSTQQVAVLQFIRKGTVKSIIRGQNLVVEGTTTIENQGLGTLVANLDGDFQNIITTHEAGLSEITLTGTYLQKIAESPVISNYTKGEAVSKLALQNATIEGDIQNISSEFANGTLSINGVQVTGNLYHQIKDSATGTTTITETQVLGKMQNELDDLASGDFTVYNSVVTNDGTAVQVIMNSTGQYIESFTNSSLYQKYKASSLASALRVDPEFTVPLVSLKGTRGEGTRNWSNIKLYANTQSGVPVIEEVCSGNYSQRTTELGTQTTQTGAGDGWFLHLLDTATVNETSSLGQILVRTGSSTRKYIEEGATLLGNYQGNTATQTQASTSPLKYKLIKGTYKRNDNNDIETANTSSTAVVTEQQGGKSHILSYNGTVENPLGAGMSITFSGDAAGTHTESGRVATAKGVVQSFDTSALAPSSTGVTLTTSNGVLKSSDPTQPALQVTAPAVQSAPKVSCTATAMQMNAPANITGQVNGTLVNFASQGLNSAPALLVGNGANVKATVASFVSTHDQDGDGTASTILVDGATAVLQSVNAAKTSGGNTKTGNLITARNGGVINTQVVTLETDVEDSPVVSAQDTSTVSLSQIIATIGGADNGLSFLNIDDSATGSLQTARVLGRRKIAGGSGKLNVATNVANADGEQYYASTLVAKVEANSYQAALT
jgi:hypothetical protein